VRRAVETVFDPDGDADVARKLAADLGALWPAYWTEARLRQVMAEFMAKAMAEVRMQAG
jgi:hypothetical protein